MRPGAAEVRRGVHANRGRFLQLLPWRFHEAGAVSTSQGRTHRGIPEATLSHGPIRKRPVDRIARRLPRCWPASACEPATCSACQHGGRPGAGALAGALPLLGPSGARADGTGGAASDATVVCPHGQEGRPGRRHRRAGRSSPRRWTARGRAKGRAAAAARTCCPTPFATSKALCASLAAFWTGTCNRLLSTSKRSSRPGSVHRDGGRAGAARFAALRLPSAARGNTGKPSRRWLSR